MWFSVNNTPKDLSKQINDLSKKLDDRTYVTSGCAYELKQIFKDATTQNKTLSQGVKNELQALATKVMTKTKGPEGMGQTIRTIASKIFNWRVGGLSSWKMAEVIIKNAEDKLTFLKKGNKAEKTGRSSSSTISSSSSADTNLVGELGESEPGATKIIPFSNNRPSSLNPEDRLSTSSRISLHNIAPPNPSEDTNLPREAETPHNPAYSAERGSLTEEDRQSISTISNSPTPSLKDQEDAAGEVNDNASTGSQTVNSTSTSSLSSLYSFKEVSGLPQNRKQLDEFGILFKETAAPPDPNSPAEPERMTTYCYIPPDYEIKTSTDYLTRTVSKIKGTHNDEAFEVELVEPVLIDTLSGDTENEINTRNDLKKNFNFSFTDDGKALIPSECSITKSGSDKFIVQDKDKKHELGLTLKSEKGKEPYLKFSFLLLNKH